jgi:hypothetical protein
VIVALVAAVGAAPVTFGQTPFDQIRISSTGPDGETLFDASFPKVAYGSSDDRYFVVWEAEDDTTTPGGDSEIFGQLVDVYGGLVGERVRISNMGPVGAPEYDGNYPAVAYDSDRDQFLVVWSGDDAAAPLVEGETEIFGQRLDAGGALIGERIRISDMGPDGDPAFDAGLPAVAYNPDRGEFFVVWSGDDDTWPLVDGEFEIFGRRIQASTGILNGGELRISNMGTISDPGYGAFHPAIVYNTLHHEYLVVWSGADDEGALVRDEYEIYAQRLADTGVQIGVNDIRVSDMGGDGNPAFDAERPDVLFNPVADEYLVVWDGDRAANEKEIFGQRLNGEDAGEIGVNDLRISFAGEDGDHYFSARFPMAAWDPDEDLYLVTWHGDDDITGMRWDEFEIFLQRLSAPEGVLLSPDGWRVSHMGPDGDRQYWGETPALAVGNGTGLLVWSGDDDEPPLVEGDFEIWGSRIPRAAIFFDGLESGDCYGWAFCGNDP